MLVPLMNEIRFLLTGNRINMQLKFRHVAEALAQASADCTHNSIKNIINVEGGRRNRKETY